MDVNLTFAVPIGVILLGASLVVNVLRLKNGKNGNGKQAEILDDLKKGQVECRRCFGEIVTGNAVNEIHLSNIVEQLRSMNGKL